MRAVVTGLGAVSALGHDCQQNWAAARAGDGKISIQSLDPGKYGPPFTPQPMALVEPGVQEKVEQVLGHRIGALDPTGVYALGAVCEALQNADLFKHPCLEHRTAIVFGHGYIGGHTLEGAYERYFAMKSRVHPLTVPRIMVSAPVSAISMEFGIKGAAFAVSSACSSSGHSVIQGAMLIEAGLADVVIVGGSEAMVAPGILWAWGSLQALSSNNLRPFSKGRDGTVMGEGAAALILESPAHAAARGAKILGELCGVGMSSDAFHWTQPSLEGATTAMTQACTQAGIVDAEGLLISAHGTGTQLNDKNEAQAIRDVFGARALSHHVVATKSAHGHLIGASTALQTVIGLMALREKLAPPVLNYLEPDPECELNLVLGEARPIAATHLLVNSFAFGGLNTALVFRAV
ncbi:MAG TPA: beta-ketoacyl-[acyl-carrier-protein] synthase family protein [Rhizomicrobium sp.]|nr:beta-ketoacyl-[acyl-carrier-protein] synthase family protein [Rhizomicrobium sp.]